jgi:hypothetical protein
MHVALNVRRDASKWQEHDGGLQLLLLLLLLLFTFIGCVTPHAPHSRMKYATSDK